MLTAPIVPGVIFAFSGYDSETLDEMLRNVRSCIVDNPNQLEGSSKRYLDEGERLLLHPPEDCVRANNDLHISFRKESWRISIEINLQILIFCSMIILIIFGHMFHVLRMNVSILIFFFFAFEIIIFRPVSAVRKAFIKSAGLSKLFFHRWIIWSFIFCASAWTTKYLAIYSDELLYYSCHCYFHRIDCRWHNPVWFGQFLKMLWHINIVQKQW